MHQLSSNFRTSVALTTMLIAAGCSSADPGLGSGTTGGTVATAGGMTGNGGATNPTNGGSATLGGAQSNGGSVTLGGAQSNGGNATLGGAQSNGGNALTGGTSAVGGSSNGGNTATGGKATGGATNAGGTATGGKATGGASNVGGSATGGVSNVGGTATGGKATGGASNVGGAATGGKATGGAPATGGVSSATGGAASTGTYACNGTTTGYNATMIKTGSNWVVTNGTQRYSGTDTTLALQAAYNSLTTTRTSKQSVLVQGDGDIPASSQFAIPSYTVLNWCGTLNVSGTSTASDRSPLYARGKTDIEIPNLKMTGSPGYGIFMRGTSNIILGNIDLRLSGGSPGIGIRIDTSPTAGVDTNFVTNLKVGYVYGSGMSSHIMETYGVDGITIGTVEGANAGHCGLLLNRSIHAEIDLVSCDNCGADTNYAAFRIANDVGRIGSAYPAGNIHVKKVKATRGGTGIFSVSGSGGLTVDAVDIANTEGYPLWFQNCYDTAILSGTISGGTVSISSILHTRRLILRPATLTSRTSC